MQVVEIHPQSLPFALPRVKAHGLHTRIVNLKTVIDREAVADRILALNDVVLIDRDRRHTRDVLLGAHDDEAWVMTFESAAGELVGYNFIRIAHVVFEGKTIACWRSRAAILPAYRGHNRTAHFPAILFAHYRLRYPLRPIYGFIGLVHPSSFKLFVKGMPGMYPYGGQGLSVRDRRVLDHLWAWSGVKAVPGRANFVISVAAWTREGVEEAAYWAESQDPAVRFFMAHNPDYRSGQAIMSFFKIDLRLFLGIAGRMLAAKLRRWL